VLAQVVRGAELEEDLADFVVVNGEGVKLGVHVAPIPQRNCLVGRAGREQMLVEGVKCYAVDLARVPGHALPAHATAPSRQTYAQRCTRKHLHASTAYPPPPYKKMQVYPRASEHASAVRYHRTLRSPKSRRPCTCTGVRSGTSSSQMSSCLSSPTDAKMEGELVCQATSSTTDVCPLYVASGSTACEFACVACSPRP
jgi:hypothetical protein